MSPTELTSLPAPVTHGRLEMPWEGPQRRSGARGRVAVGQDSWSVLAAARRTTRGAPGTVGLFSGPSPHPALTSLLRSPPPPGAFECDFTPARHAEGPSAVICRCWERSCHSGIESSPVRRPWRGRSGCRLDSAGNRSETSPPGGRPVTGRGRERPSSRACLHSDQGQQTENLMLSIIYAF